MVAKKAQAEGAPNQQQYANSIAPYRRYGEATIASQRQSFLATSRYVRKIRAAKEALSAKQLEAAQARIKWTGGEMDDRCAEAYANAAEAFEKARLETLLHATESVASCQRSFAQASMSGRPEDVNAALRDYQTLVAKAPRSDAVEAAVRAYESYKQVVQEAEARARETNASYLQAMSEAWATAWDEARTAYQTYLEEIGERPELSK